MTRRHSGRQPNRRIRHGTRRRCCSVSNPRASASSTCAAPDATASMEPTRSPMTPRCSRKPSAGPFACSSRARTRWPGRTSATRSSSTSAWHSIQRQHQRVGLRGVVGRSRCQARLQHAGECRHRLPRGFESCTVRSRTPAPAPGTPLNIGSNTAPSYIAGRVRDSAQGAGVIRSERVLSHRVLSPFFTGPLRAPERLQNTFAHECFMDEVAAHVKADPVEYRLKHLNHARLSAAVGPPPRLPPGNSGRLRSPIAHARAKSAGEASPASATRATTATWPWSLT